MSKGARGIITKTGPIYRRHEKSKRKNKIRKGKFCLLIQALLYKYNN